VQTKSGGSTGFYGILAATRGLTVHFGSTTEIGKIRTVGVVARGEISTVLFESHCT
jgi:hypothetical protein